MIGGGTVRRRMSRGFWRVLGLTAVVLIASAHIGSPDVWVEGSAGPYPVTVNVEVPGVVPGVANVYVRVTGEGVREVLASGNTFDATGGAPPPELGQPVRGAPGMYHVQLWMMTPGSSSITVVVRGAKGEGTLLIPVVIVANERLILDRPLGFGLGVVGIILFLGAIAVVGAAARESALPAGARPAPRQRRRGFVAMAVAAVALCSLLFGGWTWWNVEDAKFVKTLYRPMTSESRVRHAGGVAYLDVVITDSAWLRRNRIAGFSPRKASLLAPLVPDHGKLMHAFVIREPDMNVLAHIHPATQDSVTFSSILPPLPSGRYRVLADVVRESGYAETLTSTVTVSPEAAGRMQRGNDPDDAWFVGAPSATNTMVLAPNVQLQWDRGADPIQANIPAPLRFSVLDAAGMPVPLEPYMGMAGHAMVMRDDGSVFVHLHPTGTVSMAAQATFVARQATDTMPGMVARRMQAESGAHVGHAMTQQTVAGSHLRFPYAFPKPGQYRIWVQVKVSGRVLTGAFSATVEDAQK